MIFLSYTICTVYEDFGAISRYLSHAKATTSHNLFCDVIIFPSNTLQWHHRGPDGFSNRQPHACLLSRIFRRRSMKSSKQSVTGLFVGNSPVTGEFPAQMASYAENVSIGWRHHGYLLLASKSSYIVYPIKKLASVVALVPIHVMCWPVRCQTII